MVNATQIKTSLIIFLCLYLTLYIERGIQSINIKKVVGGDDVFFIS